MMTRETSPQQGHLTSRHRVIGPGTDTTYFTSDDTHDEMHAGSINNSIRYTGQRFDAESNLMYYKNRYYDPAAGRFIGRDPLGWREGPNRYAYVGGGEFRVRRCGFRVDGEESSWLRVAG